MSSFFRMFVGLMLAFQRQTTDNTLQGEPMKISILTILKQLILTTGLTVTKTVQHTSLKSDANARARILMSSSARGKSVLTRPLVSM